MPAASSCRAGISCTFWFRIPIDIRCCLSGTDPPHVEKSMNNYLGIGVDAKAGTGLDWHTLLCLQRLQCLTGWWIAGSFGLPQHKGEIPKVVSKPTWKQDVVWSGGRTGPAGPFVCSAS